MNSGSVNKCAKGWSPTFLLLLQRNVGGRGWDKAAGAALWWSSPAPLSFSVTLHQPPEQLSVTDTVASGTGGERAGSWWQVGSPSNAAALAIWKCNPSRSLCQPIAPS